MTFEKIAQYPYLVKEFNFLVKDDSRRLIKHQEVCVSRLKKAPMTPNDDSKQQEGTTRNKGKKTQNPHLQDSTPVSSLQQVFNTCFMLATCVSNAKLQCETCIET